MTNDMVAERLARIETKLDAALGIDKDHERRIRKVEAWMYGIPGAVIVSAAGIVIALRGGA